MAITDIKLRSKVYSGLTTKGSALTNDEIDTNFVELYAFLVALDSVGDVPNWISQEYAIGSVVKNGSAYWIAIGGPNNGITPGTDASIWQKVQASSLVHQKDRDQFLDKDGDNEVAVADVRAVVDTKLKVVKRVLTVAEILDLNSTPIEMIASVVGKAYSVKGWTIECNVEDSPASTPYDTNVTLQLYTPTGGSQITQGTSAQALISDVYRIINGAITFPSSKSQEQVVMDSALMLNVLTGNPLSGDFEIALTVLYEEITTQF